MTTVGFVVVEYNQASGQPDLRTGAELHWSLADAKTERADLQADTASVGRRETYRIAEVVLVDEEGEPL